MTDTQTEARAIQRYIAPSAGRGAAVQLLKHCDGEWVRYEDHVAALAAKDAELAAERAALRLAADRADRAEAQLAEANKALEQHREDRPYIIGWNHGFEEAMGGPLILPNMLRKMWSGSEVQAWIDNEITARRAREQGGE